MDTLKRDPGGYDNRACRGTGSREWGAAIKNSKVLVVVPCTDQGHKVRIRCTQSRHVESWVPLPHSPTCTAGVRH